MADDKAPRVTDADVRTLAAKLKGLHALLTPAEQALLHAVLRRAAGRLPEPHEDAATWAVSFNPLPYLDVIAVEVVQRLPEQVGLPWDYDTENR